MIAANGILWSKSENRYKHLCIGCTRLPFLDILLWTCCKEIELKASFYLPTFSLLTRKSGYCPCTSHTLFAVYSPTLTTRTHFLFVFMASSRSHSTLVLSTPPAVPIDFSISYYASSHQMDFLNTYFPWSPSKTPLASKRTEDQPSAQTPSNDTNPATTPTLQHSPINNSISADGKRSQSLSAVHFLAPMTEEGESLQSIKLTPKAPSTDFDTPRAANSQTCAKVAETSTPVNHIRRDSVGEKDKFLTLFGFKIRKNGFLK